MTSYNLQKGCKIGNEELVVLQVKVSNSHTFILYLSYYYIVDTWYIGKTV